MGAIEFVLAAWAFTGALLSVGAARDTAALERESPGTTHGPRLDLVLGLLSIGSWGVYSLVRNAQLRQGGQTRLRKTIGLLPAVPLERPRLYAITGGKAAKAA
jgi:hypothetical protein